MIWRALGGCRMLIRNRPPKILSGREFTVQEIQDIQETVDTCGLPWTELVYTICEHLDWVTPTGPAAGRGSCSRPRHRSRGRTDGHGARCGPAAVGIGFGEVRHPAVE